jgi:hypothetical protein
MARPFPSITKSEADEGTIASPAFVRRIVAQEMAKMEIIGDGIDIEVEGNGRVVLRNTGKRGAGLYAWEPVIRGAALSITPGEVYVQTVDVKHVPVIGSTSLLTDPAPTLPINAAGNTFINLKVTINKSGNATNTPWPLEASATQPSNTPLVRPYSGNPGQDGTYYFTLMQFTDGALVMQNWLARPIAVTWTYNNVLAW